MERQRLAVLGSTGSIGRQTLEIVSRYGDMLEVNTLTANNNWEMLAAQAREYNPDSVVIANKEHYSKLKEALRDTYIKVYAGADAIEQVVASSEVDTVVTALVGYSGLFPTANAIKHRKKIALANKETLVVAGETVIALSEQYSAPIIPVDSEHSAIFQCLVGERSEIDKIILTASGGPFLHTSAEDLYKVTSGEALRHPNWVMGNKVTIDSATLMNKGFEVIEAKWLFGLKPSQIEVVIHPSSVIHSMVQFVDGAIKAQLGVPDMKLPIQYALTFPERYPMQNKYRFGNGTTFEFYEPDVSRFPCLALAYAAMEKGGNAPCVVNAANEVAVAAFLQNLIGFMDIPRIIEGCLKEIDFISSPSLEDYRNCDDETRKCASKMVNILP